MTFSKNSAPKKTEEKNTEVVSGEKLSLTEVFLAVGEKLNIPEVSWVKINLAKLRQNPETELFPKTN